MKTLMRNGRDRRSENPGSATRGKNACFWLGPISGSHQAPQPERLHSRGRIHGCTRTIRGNVRFFSLAPRAPSIHGTSRTLVAPHHYVRYWKNTGPKEASTVTHAVGACDRLSCRSLNGADSQEPARVSRSH